jgi:hypothetical protein
MPKPCQALLLFSQRIFDDNRHLLRNGIAPRQVPRGVGGAARAKQDPYSPAWETNFVFRYASIASSPPSEP